MTFPSILRKIIIEFMVSFKYFLILFVALQISCVDNNKNYSFKFPIHGHNQISNLLGVYKDISKVKPVIRKHGLILFIYRKTPDNYANSYLVVFDPCLPDTIPSLLIAETGLNKNRIHYFDQNGIPKKLKSIKKMTSFSIKDSIGSIICSKLYIKDAYLLKFYPIEVNQYFIENPTRRRGCNPYNWEVYTDKDTNLISFWENISCID